MILGLKTCGFLQKIKVFYSIAVSVSLRLGHARGKTIINRFLAPSRRFATLDVYIYAFGSDNDNFCSKSVRPLGLSH